MKNFKSTLIYLAVAVLVGALCYVQSKHPATEKEEKKAKVFENFVADDINEIHIENLGTTVTALRTPIVLQKGAKDTWRITEPVKLPADESTLRSLLTSVGGFTPDLAIEKPDLKEFGLDQPQARCTFKSKAGTTFTLLIGNKDMTGSSAYVKTGDKDTVYMVPSYSTDSLHKGIDDYRDHTFLQTDPVVAKKIQVIRDGKTLAFEKDKDNNWNMILPLQARADASKIRDLLSTLSSLRAQSFVTDHPSGLAQYGLSPPHLRVEVWPSDGGPSKAILVGHKKDKSAGLYAKTADAPTIALIGEYFDKNMDLKPSDYRDKSILQFDSGKAKGLAIHRGSKVFAYQKDDKGQWSCPGRPNAQTEASTLAAQLAGITIMDFPDHPTGTGLSSPLFTAEVDMTDGTQRVFNFGNHDNGKVYLSVDPSKDVYEVPDVVVSQMEGYYNTILTPVPAASPASNK